MLPWIRFQYVCLGLAMCCGMHAVSAQAQDEQEFQQINTDIQEITTEYNKITTLANDAYEADRKLRSAISSARLGYKIQVLNERVNRMRNRAQEPQRTITEDRKIPQDNNYQIRPQNEQTGQQNQLQVPPEKQENKLSFTNPLTGKKYTVRALERVFSARQFLDRHNFYRGRVRNGQEAGRYAVPGLRNLLWEAKLAEGARAWAERCIYKHPDSLDVGENIGYSSGAIGDPVELWYEYRYDTKHYDQVVSPDMVYLGCHTAFCPKLQVVKSNSVATNAYYSVCRYSYQRMQ
ncbi:GLIPR1-like protein 1 [Clonorchis sinensis]|uniref:GLIPR1-like protein 1 n=1 Tax=Clonorchis sinensis TaxID=79923 RepID=A0A8T1MEI9_CLOSI|nr:GLIPR1-like protein 1 [Clonorchis sinensis]